MVVEKVPFSIVDLNYYRLKTQITRPSILYFSKKKKKKIGDIFFYNNDKKNCLDLWDEPCRLLLWDATSRLEKEHEALFKVA